MKKIILWAAGAFIVFILLAVGAAWYTINYQMESPKDNDAIARNLYNAYIMGIADRLPNGGEGLSIRYTNNADGKTHYKPLERFVDANTKVTNAANQKIPLSDIKTDDKIIVYIENGPCFMGNDVDGCKFTITAIQDFSTKLPEEMSQPK